MVDLSSYRCSKIVKTLGAFVRASLIIAIAAIALQALDVFLAPPCAYAEDIRQQRLPEQIKVGYQHRYDVKIRESLALQKDFGNPSSALATLDHLLGKIKKKIKTRSRYNKEEAVELLKTIGGVLKEEGKFEYRENKLLIEGLKRQKNGRRFIDCDDYSSIYLFAAQRLGLSLEPVYVPKHVFLMCRLDDTTDFYWEPTIAAEKDMGFYRKWLNIPEDSGYPRVLSEGEFEAIQFCNLGVAWYEKGEYKKSVEYFMRAARLDPSSALAFNNLGASYARQGNFGLAMGNYKKATSLDPNYAAAFSNIGVAFYRMGEFEKAVEYFEKAIEVDPKYDRAYDYKIAVLIKKGERKKALRFINEMYESMKKTSSHSPD